MEQLLPYAPLALLGLIAASVAEGLLLQRGGRYAYDWRGLFNSLGDLALRIGMRLLPLGALPVLLEGIWAHRIATIPLDRAWSWCLLFVGQEFCYYWMHRADHRVRWLWATHAVHHSPTQLNLSAAYRLGFTQRLSGAAVFFAPLVWIGFPPMIVLGALAMNLFYQFWLHATWIPKLGPLEWVFNTPSHHRVHHAANPQYIDRNFGGVLIVFDRLFGTFTDERAQVPCRYGLAHAPQASNALTIAIHEWRNLLRDTWRARTPLAMLATVLGPPPPPPDSARDP